MSGTKGGGNGAAQPSVAKSPENRRKRAGIPLDKKEKEMKGRMFG